MELMPDHERNELLAELQAAREEAARWKEEAYRQQQRADMAYAEPFEPITGVQVQREGDVTCPYLHITLPGGKALHVYPDAMAEEGDLCAVVLLPTADTDPTDSGAQYVRF
jgi:hypothetical protein